MKEFTILLFTIYYLMIKELHVIELLVKLGF